MTRAYEPDFYTATAACGNGRHWNCSGRVVRGFLPIGPLGHFEPCSCVCHDGICTRCGGSGQEPTR